MSIDNRTDADGKKKRNKGKSILSVKDMSEEERKLHKNAEILRMMPDNISDALAKARNKPIWCSDIRWRMELRRRQYYKW